MVRLHNPELTTEPTVVRFQTRREHSPPSIDGLRIQQVVPYFARADGASFEMPVTHLHFTEQGSVDVIGGGAVSVDSAISTLRGNAGSWVPMIGKAPFGAWELALRDTEGMRIRFKNEQIEGQVRLFSVKPSLPPSNSWIALTRAFSSSAWMARATERL